LTLQHTELLSCDDNRDGKFFNLTNANNQIVNPQAGLVLLIIQPFLTYQCTNPIAAFTNFESARVGLFLHVTLNATYKIIQLI
jgi:hypothetical protein